MSRRALALLGLLCGSLGCSNLPVIDEGCGNAVLEPDDEDCDSFAEEGQFCRPSGDEFACRYDCSTMVRGIEAKCPKHMGCGNDGICRLPTDELDEEFDVKQSLTSDPSTWLSSADFDGDGKKELLSTEPEDLLGLGRFRLHYFDRNSRVSETRTFPRFTTRPLVVNRQGSDDLIFSNGRIGFLAGRADREWVPAAFSSYVVEGTRMRVVTVRDDVVNRSIPVVAIATIAGVFGLYVPDAVSGQLELRSALPGEMDDIVGAPLAADLIAGPDSPCAELVLAFRGDSRLYVHDMCEPIVNHGLDEVAWRPSAQRQIVQLDRPVLEAPLAGDLDGDGHLDVVFGSDAPDVGSGGPYLMWGDGAGLLPGAKPLRPRLLGVPPGTAPQPGADLPPTLPMPIAMGDFSGDGIADFVLPQQLVLSRPAADGSGVGYVFGAENRAEPWTMAEIADLNGNGFPDVVVASAGSTGFTFHNGTGGPYLIDARVATARPLLHMTTGDFDGDLMGDLALIEGGAQGDGKDTLSVAYGARDAVPLPAKRVTEVTGAEQLGHCSNGGVDVLFMATARLDDGLEGTFTLFDTGPDRLPIATYSLVTFSVDSGIRDYTAASLVVGRFSHKAATDVMAIGVNLRDASDDWTQWLVPEIGSQLEPPRKLSMAEQPMADPRQLSGTTNGLSIASASADLEDDDLDEALWLIPREGVGCSLLIYDVDVRPGKANLRQELLFATACPKPELAVADLDRDKHPDVLMLLGSVASDHKSRLEVLWNDGEGGFSLSARTTLVDEYEALHAFSVRDGQSEVAFASDSSLTLVKLDRQTRTFDEPRKVADLVNGRAVAFVDPNADDQLDLVVSDELGLWLLRRGLKADDE